MDEDCVYFICTNWRASDARKQPIEEAQNHTAITLKAKVLEASNLHKGGGIEFIDWLMTSVHVL